MLTWIREKFGKAVIGGIITVIALVFVFYGVFNPRSTRGIHDGAVAGTVNGDPISISDFNRAYNRQMEMFKNMMGGANISAEQLKQFRIGESVFNELARRKIMIQEAEKQGNTPSDEEIRSQISAIPAFQANGKFDPAAYRQTLEANGYTPATFEEMVKQDLEVQRWESYFKNRVNVSDDEVKLQFLIDQDKRNIKYVLLTNEAGKKAINVDPAEVQKYLTDPAKLNLLKSQFEAKKDKQFKGKTFDDVKTDLARDVIAGSKVDEIKKANDKIAAEILPLLKADKSSDAQVNKILKPYGVEVKLTGLINQESQYIPGLGEAKDLQKDAFSDKLGTAKIYPSSAWSAVAVVSETQKPDLTKLSSERMNLLHSITSRKEKDLFDSWIKKMSADAKIDPNPAVISGGASEGG
jgi:parvulin-like peptidyl-prolyl isomerase